MNPPLHRFRGRFAGVALDKEARCARVTLEFPISEGARLVQAFGRADSGTPVEIASVPDGADSSADPLARFNASFRDIFGG